MVWPPLDAISNAKAHGYRKNGLQILTYMHVLNYTQRENMLFIPQRMALRYFEPDLGFCLSLLALWGKRGNHQEGVQPETLYLLRITSPGDPGKQNTAF